MRTASPLALLRTLSAAGVLAGAALVAGAPSAGALVPTVTVTPSTLPAGQSITVSGAGCNDPGGSGAITVTVSEGATIGGAQVATTALLPPASGDWSTTLAIPLGATPGADTVHVTCLTTDSSFAYADAALTVTPGPTTTTAATTTTSVAATSTTSGATSTTVAAAAVPVAATPTYTG